MKHFRVFANLRTGSNQADRILYQHSQPQRPYGFQTVKTKPGYPIYDRLWISQYLIMVNVFLETQKSIFAHFLERARKDAKAQKKYECTNLQLCNSYLRFLCTFPSPILRLF